MTILKSIYSLGAEMSIIKIKPKLIPFFIEKNFYLALITFLSILISIPISLHYSYFGISLIITGLTFLVLISNLIQTAIIYKKTEVLIDTEKKEITFVTGNILSSQQNKTNIENTVIFITFKNLILNYFFQTLNIELHLSNSLIKQVNINCIHAKDFEILKYLFFKNLTLQVPSSYYPSKRGLLFLIPDELKTVMIFAVIIFLIILSQDQPYGTYVLLFISMSIVSIFILTIYKLISAIIQIFNTKLSIYQAKDNSINKELQLFVYEKYQSNCLIKEIHYFKSDKISDIFYQQEIREKIFGIKKIYISFINSPDYFIAKYFDSKFEINKIVNQKLEVNDLEEDYIQTLKPSWMRFLINFFLKGSIAISFTILGFAISSVFLTLFPGISFLGLITQEFIEMITTRYYYSRKKISSKNNFLILKENIANKEDITSIRISQDPIDKLMNTINIHFYTTGGSGAIKFAHVNYDQKTINALTNIIPEEYVQNLSYGLDNYQDKLNAIIQYIGQKNLINQCIYELINIPALFTIIPSIAIYSIFFENNINLFFITSIFVTILYLLLYMNIYFGHDKSKLNIYSDIITHEYGFLTKILKIIKKDFIAEVKIETYPNKKLKRIKVIPQGKSNAPEPDNITNLFIGQDHENILSFMFLNIKKSTLKKEIFKHIFTTNNYEIQNFNIKKYPKFKPNSKVMLLRMINIMGIPIFLLAYIKLKRTIYVFSKNFLIEKYKFPIDTFTIIPYYKISNVETIEDYANKFAKTQTLAISPYGSNSSLILWDLNVDDARTAYNLIYEIISYIKINETSSATQPYS